MYFLFRLAAVKYLFITLACIFYTSSSHAQPSTRTDSPVRISETSADTARLTSLILLAKSFAPVDMNKAVDYGKKALGLAEKLGDKKNTAWALNYIGSAYYYHGHYDSATSYHKRALEIRLAINDAKGLGASYNNLGNIYDDQGNSALAMEYYQKALKYFEQISFETGMAITYNSIGNLFYTQKNYRQAMDYFSQSLKIHERHADTMAIIHAVNNIAVVWDELGDKGKAMENYRKSLAMAEKAGLMDAILTCYSNLAQLYNGMKDYSMAEFYFRKFIVLNRTYGDSAEFATVFSNMGSMFRDRGRTDSALHYYQLSLQMAFKQKLRSFESADYLYISDLYARKKDFKKAYDYHKRYSELKDTLLNEENSKQINEMQAKFETEKKDKELIKKDAEIARQNSESRQRETERNAFIAGFVLVLVLAFFIFRSYRQKQKANVEISRQKEIIEEKQKEILDSIHYAKRIQQSLLPTEKYVERNLKRLKA